LVVWALPSVPSTCRILSLAWPRIQYQNHLQRWPAIFHQVR
jgi:hypothetical protein